MLSAQSGHVIIEVSPTRLELAALRGRRIVASAARRICVPEFESAWPGSLDQLRGALGELVQQAGCRGASAVVVFHAPAAAATVCSCPAAFSSAEAEGAAMLAVAAVADFPIEGEPCELRTALVDAPAVKTEVARQSHMVCAAASGADIEALSAWVRSSGLRFAGAVPGGAVALQGAMRGAWAIGRRAGDRAAVLWIGEHGSALASVTEGSVRFVRPVAMGIESLVEALGQPLRGRDEGTAELTLDVESARRLLCEVGVPAPDAPLPGYEGFTGAAVLPVLQPGLQRITIETKQSLRFGLPEQERAGARLAVAGPGAAIPGLGAWIARQCGLTLADGSEQTTGTMIQSAMIGAIAECARGVEQLPLLVPAGLMRQRTARRARMALAAGVAVAGALLAYEWRAAAVELEHQSARVAQLEQRAEADRRYALVRDAALAARLALSSVQGRARSVMGEAGDPAGALAAIAAAAPEGARLSLIDVAHENGVCVCRVSGFVRLSESEDPAAVIKSFVDELGRVPVVSGARLGSTQRVLVDGAQSQTFDLTLQLVGLPVAPPQPLSRAEGEP